MCLHLVQRHIPKFLQVHSHLLHKGGKPDEPKVEREDNDSDIEDYDGVRAHQGLRHRKFNMQFPCSCVCYSDAACKVTCFSR